MPPALNTQQQLAARKQVLRAEAAEIRREIKANAADLKPAVDAINLGWTVVRTIRRCSSLVADLLGSNATPSQPTATSNRLAPALKILSAGWRIFAALRSK